MRRLVLAAVAVALVAPAAHGSSGSCLAIADPAGDLQVWGGTPPLPAGTELDAVDLLSVDVEGTTGWAVTATFTLAAPPAPRPGMRYVYRVRFHDADYDYELSADVDNVVRTPVAGAPYELAVTPHSGGAGWTYSVSGSIDATGRTVTVAAFGWTAPVLDLNDGHAFTVDGAETFAGPGAVYGPLDSVNGPHTLVVGSGCP